MMDGRALIAKPARSMHDWLKATEDERQALYTATKRVVDGHFRGDWRKCIAEAFAGEHVGDSFEDNFRKGKISRKDASAIGRWLAGAQPEEFQRLEAALAQRAGLGWMDFLKSYQKTDALRVVRATDLGLVGLAGRAKAATQRVELGEEFFLQLTTAINGTVIGLQRSGGSWFYLPLNALFLDMIGADPSQRSIITRAEITSDFRIVVFGKFENPLDPSQDLNGASRRALTIAFILALTKVSEVEAPNVIDTPLGMMSGYVKREVLRLAAEQSSQLVLFLTHSEIAGCEDILDKWAGRIYTVTNPAHYPKILVNDPGVDDIGVLLCDCDHRDHCDLCERREERSGAEAVAVEV